MKMTKNSNYFNDIRNKINKWAFDAGMMPEVLDRGRKGAIIGALDEYTMGKEGRYRVLGWLFGTGNRMSTKELKENQWRALYKWCDFYQDEDSNWNVGAGFADECFKIRMMLDE